MAQFMLREALAEAGLDDKVQVDSAGTTAYEVGHPIDPRAARILTARRIMSDSHVAREWKHDWFAERDLILALDVDHYGWLREAAPDQESRSKVRMFRSFDPKAAGKHALDQGIEDPWFGGHADFESAWQMIHDAIPGIVEYVASELAARQRGEQQVRSIS